MRGHSRWVVALCGGLLLAAAGSAAPAPERGPLVEKLLDLPLTFEENRGQAESSVRFIARGPAYSVLVGAGGMTFVMREAGEAGLPDPAAGDGTAPSPRASRVDGDRWRMVQMRWLGGGQAGGFEALDQRPSRSHYLRGNDSSAWVTDVPQFARTRLLGVWPGVDVELYGNGRYLEFDLVVDPGTTASGLGVELVGVEGIELDAGSGDAVVRFGKSELRLRKPIAWEELDGDRRRLAVDYDLAGRQVRFVVAGRDERARLVIDPVVELSTYLGGTGEDVVTGLALDAAGAIYVTGYTAATDFPLANAMQAQRRGDSDVFVTKLSPAGDALVYSTYLGGSRADWGNGIAVDGAGSAYVTGSTRSRDFPLHNPLQGASGPSADAFVVKLTPAGDALAYSTLLGGSRDDGANAIAVDAAGAAYVVGVTRSRDFPLQRPLQATFGGRTDAFVVKLAPAGDTLVYATYLGGRHHERARGVAVDVDGAVYVTGETGSRDFPTHRPIQKALGGYRDMFIAKLQPEGGGFVYATYLGGNRDDSGRAIAVDSAGAAYVTGETESWDFPFLAIIKTVRRTFGAVPVVKLTPDGSALAYSTALRGASPDRGNGIAVDSTGAAYVVGVSVVRFHLLLGNHSDTGPAENSTFAAFVAKLNPAGDELAYLTHLDGRDGETAMAVAVDAAGVAHVGGTTSSWDFPLAKPLQNRQRSLREGFVARIVDTAAEQPALAVAASTSAGP